MRYLGKEEKKQTDVLNTSRLAKLDKLKKRMLDCGCFLTFLILQGKQWATKVRVAASCCTKIQRAKQQGFVMSGTERIGNSA